MLTIAVCDDNPQFASVMTKKLRKLCAYSLPDRVDCQVICEFGSANQVLHYIQNKSIDILFLDIDMPRVDGFGLAKVLKEKYPDTIIVFVSSYENFVFNSFEYNPFRFLRKSHLKEELPITLNEIIKKCIIDSETLTFNTTDGEKIIRIRDILYFESNKNYYDIHCTSKSVYKCRGTITEVESLVKEYDFYRIHSSFVINEENIDCIDNKNFTVHMNNGVSLNISRKKMPEFKKRYMAFIHRRYAK